MTAIGLPLHISGLSQRLHRLHRNHEETQKALLCYQASDLMYVCLSPCFGCKRANGPPFLFSFNGLAFALAFAWGLRLHANGRR